MTEKRLLDDRGRPYFDLQFYALAKDGRIAAATAYEGSKFAVCDSAGRASGGLRVSVQGVGKAETRVAEGGGRPPEGGTPVKRGTVASGTSSPMRNERLVEGPPSAIPPSAFRPAPPVGFPRGRCNDGIPIFERARPHSAHERYADGLERAGLANSALARDWLAAATSSIRQAVPVSAAVPRGRLFRRVGSARRRLRHQAPRWTATRCDRARRSAGAPLTVFLDLFQQTADTANPLDLVASLDSATVLQRRD